MAAVVLLVKVAMVFGLLAAVLWVLKRTDGLGARGRSGLEVRGSTRLGKGAALTVVRVDGKELLLGVTDHAVTLLRSEPVPDEPEQEQPARTPLAQSLGSVLGTALRTALRGKPDAAQDGPPSLRAFLRDALAARQAPAEVPADDVAAALAALRGGPQPTPALADGTATARTRAAARRRVARTDAQRDEEQLWSRPCRPTHRAADGDDGLA